jgi:hypothetical protein
MMALKSLMLAGAVLFAASAYAQASHAASSGASSRPPGHSLHHKKKSGNHVWGAYRFAPGREMRRENTKMPSGRIKPEHHREQKH